MGSTCGCLGNEREYELYPTNGQAMLMKPTSTADYRSPLLVVNLEEEFEQTLASLPISSEVVKVDTSASLAEQKVDAGTL